MQKLAGAGLVLLAIVLAGVAGAAEGSPQPRPIYGTAEEVFIPELGIRVPAKIDTGAESASLSAAATRSADGGSGGGGCCVETRSGALHADGPCELIARA